MKIIVLTGYSEEQFEKEEAPGCYLCKRRPGEKGVFLAGSKKEPKIGACELSFTWVERVKAGKIFRYPVCHECLPLLEGTSEKQNPLINLIKRPSLN